MKFFTFSILIILSSQICLAQSKRSLDLIRPTTSGGNLLVLKENSVGVDTLMEGPFDRLTDYFINSEYQVAVIMEMMDNFWYYQFHKSKLYDVWTIDSMAQWQKPAWVDHLKNPNKPEFRARYALQDFNTVIKIVDNGITVMDLKSQKANNAQPPMHERELYHVIQTLSEDSTKDWTSIDSVFQNHVVPTPSNKLRHFSFLMLVRKKEFLAKADTSTLEYYADQFARMEYHHDIKFYIQFMKTLASYWPSERINQYASTFYKKNTAYWNAKFSGTYWDDKKTEHKELELLMKKTQVEIIRSIDENRD